MNVIQHLTRAVGIVTLLAAAGCATQQTAERVPSGTYTVTYDNVGGLVGFRTGAGRIVLNDGSEYAFTADGYSLAAIGYSVATASGTIYNLNAPADFSGEYGAIGGSAILGKGSTDVALKNRGNDVIIDVASSETGLRIGLGGGFTTFKLGEQLKGPRVAVVAPPPAPAPVMVPKPTRHEIEFGFNKSRVNLATARLLDGIAADWKDKDAVFDVIGHADTVGSNRFNDRLSTARAANVKRRLVSGGISPDRITARGVGQTDLAVATPDETRLRANRRVVITIRTGK